MTDTPTTLRLSRSGKVQVIAYDRPEQRNAWNATCARETVEAILAANADPQVGAIVLTGEGATFCAGADLKAKEFDPETGRRQTPATFTMGTGDGNLLSLIERSKPVVAAINGPAIGIGATHALCADIRVSGESGSFNFPFLKLGAMPECGSSALLGRLIGPGRATDVLLRSRKIDARQALAWGLVTEVFPDDELRDQAIALAEQLAGTGALQMRLTKQMLAQNMGNGDAEAIMKVENRAFLELLKTMKADKPLPAQG
ncbi:enoyl-CoA hydratase/isomerase family protein [Novosphingobium bradum]|uniref:Enoyl-CoA hydratase/isomerase family protein n=1 Tax=Novosphingobium bradum TaxID=1737444 RepID=A0ABV7IPA7_9SPHN